MSPGRALVIVLARPQIWSRLGMAITGAGFYISPEQWQLISAIGLIVFPAIAQVLDEVKLVVERSAADKPQAP